ncbi:MAG TPA: glycine cleavage system protein GcvH [Candidatus Brocadiia bacterium]|nr:glycine cleavage system protein GcvH [Candidatus Brocadiia bacterium]
MPEGNEVPSDLRYSKDHEWVKIVNGVAVIGITDHAQHELGGVTFVDLPPKGKKVAQFGELAAVESAKAASDIFAPVGGVVAEVNTALEDAPETVNSDPYGDGWLCRLEQVDAKELDKLMTAEQYAKYLEQA